MTACRPNPLRRRRPNSGEKNGLARLTETEVVIIRQLRAAWMGRRVPNHHPSSIANIAKRFGISTGHVSRIVLGFQWRHL